MPPCFEKEYSLNACICIICASSRVHATWNISARDLSWRRLTGGAIIKSNWPDALSSFSTAPLAWSCCSKVLPLRSCHTVPICWLSIMLGSGYNLEGFCHGHMHEEWGCQLCRSHSVAALNECMVSKRFSRHLLRPLYVYDFRSCSLKRTPTLIPTGMRSSLVGWIRVVFRSWDGQGTNRHCFCPSRFLGFPCLNVFTACIRMLFLWCTCALAHLNMYQMYHHTREIQSQLFTGDNSDVM